MPNSSTDYLDVNVWLALSHPDHDHHDAAKEYWNRGKASKITLSRVTLFGLLRMLTNPHVMKGRLATPAKAWSVGQTYLSLPEVEFLVESPAIEGQIGIWAQEAFFTGKLWTDAWIAAVAMANGCRVVSFDADFAKFPGLRFLHLKP